MKKVVRVAYLFLAMVLALAPCAQADNNYYWLPTSGTDSWFNASNWDENEVPGATNIVYVDTLGVCSFDAGSNALVHRVGVQGLTRAPLSELVIEPGAVLTVTNIFGLGNVGRYGKCTIRGTVEVLNDYNNGVYLGGYDGRFDDSYGEITIDGGTLKAALTYFKVGSVGTGLVTIVNGGVLYNNGITRIGEAGAYPDPSEGTIVLNDGIWTNGGGITVGANGGHGTVEINGGILSSTATGFTCLTVASGANSVGNFYLNDGEFIGTTVQRELIIIGNNDATGTFIQNGGVATAIGLNIAPGTGLGTATAIFSNGVFNARPTSGSWPAFRVGGGGSLVMAGGNFNGTSVSSTGIINDGATLEMRAGSLSIEYIFYAYSNSTIRLIGPLWDFSCSWWRANNASLQYSNMELILTKDAGHMTAIQSPSGSPCGLPRTLKVGFEGGACLLSTNAFGFVEAGSYFESYVDPATEYGLDLWDSAKVINYAPPSAADILQISLKAAAYEGSATIPTTLNVGVADKAYGYVDVSGMAEGTLPELLVTMGLTVLNGTIGDILADLQAAGYTNSALAGASAITMAIPDTYITTDIGHFAWDFREFDGTTNATVSALNFKFQPEGTIISVR